jgi:hypothetical protein
MFYWVNVMRVYAYVAAFAASLFAKNNLYVDDTSMDAILPVAAADIDNKL